MPINNTKKAIYVGRWHGNFVFRPTEGGDLIFVSRAISWPPSLGDVVELIFKKFDMSSEWVVNAD